MILSEARNLIDNYRLNTTAAQKWADLGSGSGLFSKALLSLLPAGSIVFAIDKTTFAFSDPGIQFFEMDFEKEILPLPLLNGIMMANSLHFVKDKLSLLQQLKKNLLPGSIFLLVEYDTNIANRWVPYPLSFSSATLLFKQAGFDSIEKNKERHSVYNSAKIYSAYLYRST